jgi:hypothetical protein
VEVGEAADNDPRISSGTSLYLTDCNLLYSAS